jgi:hypothetical protein
VWPMTEEALKETLSAYVLIHEREGPQNRERQEAAHETVHNWIETDPEQAWRFIEVAYRSEISDHELALVAAGAVEEFLAARGEQYFERLETAVRQERRARFMVAGVWKGGMSNSLWERFVGMRERLGIKPI